MLLMAGVSGADCQCCGPANPHNQWIVIATRCDVVRLPEIVMGLLTEMR